MIQNLYIVFYPGRSLLASIVKFQMSAFHQGHPSNIYTFHCNILQGNYPVEVNDNLGLMLVESTKGKNSLLTQICFFNLKIVG